MSASWCEAQLVSSLGHETPGDQTTQAPPNLVERLLGRKNVGDLPDGQITIPKLAKDIKLRAFIVLASPSRDMTVEAVAQKQQDQEFHTNGMSVRRLAPWLEVARPAHAQCFLGNPANYVLESTVRPRKRHGRQG
jgi:hypothetical protein